MQCLKCGGEVWDNTIENEKRKNEGKKERPVYSCKDKDGCGWVMWPEKGVKKVLVESHLPSKVPQQEGNCLKERAMIMAYAKDLVVAQINMGTFAGQASMETIDIFRKLWNEYLNPNEKL